MAFEHGRRNMQPDDRDAEVLQASHGAARKPWTAPKVILSDPMSRARRHSNKGQNITPDNRAETLTSTSTS